RFPYGEAMARAGKGQRKVELEARLVEIRLQLNAYEVRDGAAARCERRSRGREKADPREVSRARRDAERGEGGAHARLEGRRLRHSPPRPRARGCAAADPRGR